MCQRDKHVDDYWNIAVARGYESDAMDALASDQDDPVTPGGRFLPNPDLAPSGVTFSLVARNLGNGATPDGTPLGYLLGGISIETQDDGVVDEDDLAAAGITLADDSTESWHDAVARYTHRRWSITAEIDYLFVDATMRGFGCARALVMAFVGLVCDEIRKIQDTIGNAGERLDLRLYLVSEPHGDGGHAASVMFLRAMEEIFGSDPDSAYAEPDEDQEAIHGVRRLAFLLLEDDDERMALDGLLDRLRERADGARRPARSPARTSGWRSTACSIACANERMALDGLLDRLREAAIDADLDDADAPVRIRLRDLIDWQ